MYTRIILAIFISVLYSSSFAITISSGFTTNNTAEPLVIDTIRSAKKQILVAAYSFTSKPIAEELLHAYKRGVKVFVIVDKTQEGEKYTSATFIANAGIPVRIDKLHAIMHNKFIIVDNFTVQTGSFNYTKSATEYNAENVIRIDGDYKLVESYVNEWKTHWEHSKEYRSK